MLFQKVVFICKNYVVFIAEMFYQFLLQNCAFALSYRNISFGIKFYFFVYKAIENGLFPLIQNNLQRKMHFFALIKIGIQLLRFLILISSTCTLKNEKKLSQKRKKSDIIGAFFWCTELSCCWAKTWAWTCWAMTMTRMARRGTMTMPSLCRRSHRPAALAAPCPPTGESSRE